MKRRAFITKAGIVTLGASTISLTACMEGGSQQKQADTPAEPEPDAAPASAFELPELGYGYTDLQPAIDAQTMEIHHSKHHAGYVRKLNKALEGHAMSGKTLEEIVSGVGRTDADTGVRNNGGGHYNHSLFWKVMTPGGGTEPTGALADAINANLTSFDEMKTQFAAAAAGVFGSGWAWLAVNADKQLYVTSTPNQDNPLMANVAEEPGTPIMGIDVWEHAYYLNYQNRRKDYIDAFMGLINWEQVAANFEAAQNA